MISFYFVAGRYYTLLQILQALYYRELVMKVIHRFGN
jgi:hypothetical protein